MPAMDKARAETILATVNAAVKVIDDEIATLTGKDNKKKRNDKGREAAALKKDVDYIDAERVMAGKEPLSDNNKGSAAPAVPAAGYPVFAMMDPITGKEIDPNADNGPRGVSDDKKKAKEVKKEGKAKKEESAGISPTERAELDKLKADLISRKTELKAQGMTGGQQNKDPQISEWVARMKELKIKSGEEDAPGSGSTKKKEKKPKAGSEAVEKLTAEIEDYKENLRIEFKYTKSEINKDPDLVEMMAKLKVLEKAK